MDFPSKSETTTGLSKASLMENDSQGNRVSGSFPLTKKLTLKQEARINIYSANMLHIHIAKSVQLAVGMLQVLQVHSFIIMVETLGKNISTYQIFVLSTHLQIICKNDTLKFSLGLLSGCGTCGLSLFRIYSFGGLLCNCFINFQINVFDKEKLTHWN